MQVPRLKDPRRWLLLASIPVVLAVWALTPKSTSHNRGGTCLVHSDCISALRCYAVPNADGFATAGSCVETCVDDEQCQPADRCTITAEGSEQLIPVAVGRSPGERVCLKGAR